MRGSHSKSVVRHPPNAVVVTPPHHQIISVATLLIVTSTVMNCNLYFPVILGDPVKGSIDPQRGHHPQVENSKLMIKVKVDHQSIR